MENNRLNYYDLKRMLLFLPIPQAGLFRTRNNQEVKPIWAGHEGCRWCFLLNLQQWRSNSLSLSLSDPSLSASEPTTASASSSSSTSPVSGSSLEDMMADDGSINRRECSHFLRDMHFACVCFAWSIAVRVTSLRALQWQTAHSHVLQSALQMSA